MISTPSLKRVTHYTSLGFSLVELLVVIGVLAILVGFLTPAVMRAVRQANVTRQASDLQAIAVALNAYKDDFNDYPRLPPPNTVAQPNSRATYDAGEVILAWALIGPYDKTKVQNQPPPFDGADGMGFRIRSVPWNQPPQGKVYGPYIQADRVKLKKFTVNGADFYEFVDRSDAQNPILYFVRHPGVTVANFAATTGNAQYDTSYCGSSFVTDASQLAAMQASLTAAITAKGTAANFTGPFILWSAGADGNYGTKDDVSSIP